MRLIETLKAFRRSSIALLALSIPIGLGLNLLASMLGPVPGGLPFVLGMLAFMIAWVVLHPWDNSRSTVRAFGAFLYEHRASCLRAAAYIGICAFFNAYRTQPASPELREVLALADSFGMMFLAFLPAAAYLYRSSGFCLMGFAVRFLHNAAILHFVLWLGGKYGDHGLAFVSTHVHAAIAGAVLIAVFLMLAWATGSLRDAPASSADEHEPFASMSHQISKTTARDTRYIAAHEAGHVMCYGALGSLPEDFTVAVKQGMDGTGILGYVSGFQREHRLVERTFAEWLMLTLLAGKMGEARMQGETTFGSRADHAQWLALAHDYLSTLSDGIYYAQPTTDLEQKHNADALHVLQGKQLKMLGALFDQNVDVFERLVTELEVKRTLGRAEVIDLISRINLPSGFPMPFGAFDEYSVEWKGDSATRSPATHA